MANTLTDIIDIEDFNQRVVGTYNEDLSAN